MPKPRKHGQQRHLYGQDLPYDHAAQMNMVERSGVQAWRHPAEDMEPAVELGMVMEMASRLAKLLQWLSDGRSGGTLDLRTWAMLYVMRPDLLNGETMREFAARRGTQVSRIHAMVAEFRNLFPTVQFTKPSRAERRTKDDLPTPPPGKASL